MVSSHRPPSKFDWRKSLAALLVLIGLGTIALSFLSPGKTSQQQAWSDTQAQQYQATSAKLHALSHEISHATPEQKQAVQDQLNKTQAEYNALRGELESAIARPNRVAWAMRIAGLLCVAVGGGILYYLPDSDAAQSDGQPSKAVHIKREK
jgi:hypothetical protein